MPGSAVSAHIFLEFGIQRIYNHARFANIILPLEGMHHGQEEFGGALVFCIGLLIGGS